ncbi:NAD-dependent epimerase/dehydratase [Candidatus Gottesmanbacteria bacterium]|nr:NAD-dependent epimerase/dehydratase [Candidatus Gottesmanbacteria bacterium]
MNILITGGGGYIGYHLVKLLLLSTKHKVTVLDSFIYEKHSLDDFKRNKRLTIIKGDICNIIDMVKALRGIDTVIALAAIVGDPACALNEDQTLSTNFHSTNLLVRLCNQYKIRRIIFASSCSVYGADSNLLNEGSRLNPLSLYAKTRVMSEELIRKNLSPDLDYVILRLATVFGWSKRVRFDLVVNFLTTQAFYTKQIDIINGDQWRPIIHVGDVARAIKLIISDKSGHTSKEILNIGGNALNIQIKDIVKHMEKYIKGITIHFKDVGSDIRNYRVSFDKVKNSLGFIPKYNLDYGIKEIIKELKRKNINYLEDKYYNVKYLYKHQKNDN